MCTEDWTRILQTFGTMYPEHVKLAHACRHCGDAERTRRAVAELIERGFVDARLTRRGGRLSSELHLTEAGMAVAFGVAWVEEDAREAIAAREQSLLRDLDRVRATRQSRLGVRGTSERDHDER